MTPQSAKAKGRRLQQEVRDALRSIGSAYGLEDGDIESRSMGAAGTDIILSPAAKRVFGRYAIECKNVEHLNVSGIFWKFRSHVLAGSEAADTVAILVHDKNRTEEPLVTLRLTDFLAWLERDADRRLS